MKMNVKSVYEAPVVELFEARVEKGFAGSGNQSIDATLEPVEEETENVVPDDEFMGR